MRARGRATRRAYASPRAPSPKRGRADRAARRAPASASAAAPSSSSSTGGRAAAACGELLASFAFRNSDPSGLRGGSYLGSSSSAAAAAASAFFAASACALWSHCVDARRAPDHVRVVHAEQEDSACAAEAVARLPAERRRRRRQMARICPLSLSGSTGAAGRTWRTCRSRTVRGQQLRGRSVVAELAHAALVERAEEQRRGGPGDVSNCQLETCLEHQLLLLRVVPVRLRLLHHVDLETLQLVVGVNA